MSGTKPCGPAQAAIVARLKQERKEFLGSFPGLDESLVKSLG